MIRETARQFAETELMPIAGDTDKLHRFPAAAIAKLGELGLMGISVDTKYGGAGMDTLSYALAMEEISRYECFELFRPIISFALSLEDARRLA